MGEAASEALPSHRDDLLHPHNSLSYLLTSSPAEAELHNASSETLVSSLSLAIGTCLNDNLNYNLMGSAN